MRRLTFLAGIAAGVAGVFAAVWLDEVRLDLRDRWAAR